MKIANLFLTAALVGVLSVIGCGDSGSSNEGGDGGNGGGTMCEFTAQQVCAECDAQDKIPDCVSFFENCLVTDPGGNVCEKCSGLALTECGI